jgi:ribosome biogenesis GTPase A
MAIQWFPGHMHLTRKAIAERIKDIDAVIELLDARLPGSSANPLLAELTGGRPSLKVLNKQDVADPELTAAWLAHYNSLPGPAPSGWTPAWPRPRAPSSTPATPWRPTAAGWPSPCAC